MALSEFVEDVLQFTGPRDNRSDAQDIQLSLLSSFKPSFSVVPSLLGCYCPRGLEPEASLGALEIFGEEFST